MMKHGMNVPCGLGMCDSKILILSQARAYILDHSGYGSPG